MDRDLIRSYFEKAVNYHVNDNFQSAHDLYRAILEVDPKNSDCSYLLGILYLQNGFISQGQTLLSQVGGHHTSNHFFHNSFSFKYQIENRDKLDETKVEKFVNSTINTWRHFRMIDFAKNFDQKAKWLTVGDQKGHDYWMLSELGFEDVTASNLFDDSLGKSAKINNIKKFRALNAEKIDADDCSFDYVLCKEALHHMPRPYMALYEMLRVAAKAVCIIEPQDSLVDYKAIKSTPTYREFISDSLIGKKISYKRKDDDLEITSIGVDWWESEDKNYVYTLSEREIAKLSFGLGLPCFAFKSFNDFYDENLVKGEPIIGNLDFDTVLEQIKLKDSFCEITGSPSSYITGIFFKESPDHSIIENLNNLGFTFVRTPSRFLPISWPNIPGLF
jgi:hypothetical protein